MGIPIHIFFFHCDYVNLYDLYIILSPLWTFYNLWNMYGYACQCMIRLVVFVNSGLFDNRLLPKCNRLASYKCSCLTDHSLTLAGKKIIIQYFVITVFLKIIYFIFCQNCVPVNVRTGASKFLGGLHIIQSYLCMLLYCEIAKGG